MAPNFALVYHKSSFPLMDYHLDIWTDCLLELSNFDGPPPPPNYSTLKFEQNLIILIMHLPINSPNFYISFHVKFELVDEPNQRQAAN